MVALICCRPPSCTAKFWHYDLKEALNDDESLAMTVFEKGVQDAVATADYFASALLDEARAKNSLYQDVDWVPPTSNKDERFFSKAKFFLGEQRHALLPENFEGQLCLRMIKQFWGLSVVQEMLNE